MRVAAALVVGLIVYVAQPFPPPLAEARARISRAEAEGLRYETPPATPQRSGRLASAADWPRERKRVIDPADRYLREAPVTITAFPAKRSAGGPHDFFSEGDYWWPDPAHPDGPYIRRDGESNPDNFVDHRHALVRLSVEVPALTAAWKLTSDDRYAAHARRHLRAWFADPSTRMTPSLEYSQAIHGIATGRGTDRGAQEGRRSA